MTILWKIFWQLPKGRGDISILSPWRMCVLQQDLFYCYDKENGVSEELQKDNASAL